MSYRPNSAPLLQSTAAQAIRNNYYDSIHKVKSISELKAMIRVIEEMCEIYKINPNFIFWTNERFASSKPEDYIIV
jgi:uncharacterized protein (DUF4213/DUF364 family)